MRVAIVHYHLRPGGVTRVIQRARTALRTAGVETIVLTGEAPGESLIDAEAIRVVPALGYADPERGERGDGITHSLLSAVGAPPDLWHFHNHSLGKNAACPRAVCELASLGHRLLLQIHDFAEDWRPSNYRLLLDRLGHGAGADLGSRLYPAAPHVHYAVLNTRDREFLSRTGLPAANVHLLPNAVPAGTGERDQDEPASRNSEDRLFLCPTRAIRRKNLGEFLLWAAVAPEGDRFATTLAPKNPAAHAIYNRWVSLARSSGLPVTFALAETTRLPFTTLLKRADFLVTTSVAEGFGLSYLEPWLVGRPLIGRNLPEVTGQLTQAGMDLSGLYDRLDIPVAWVNLRILEATVAAQLAMIFAVYGRTRRREDVVRAMAAVVKGDHVDFGRLDEKLQEAVLRRVIESPAARTALRPTSLAPAGDYAARIERNSTTVERCFGLQAYGTRLEAIYRAVAGSPRGAVGAARADVLLDAFLDPARLSLLRGM